MKALFFAVCLLNVLVFFWELHSGALPPTTQKQSVIPSIMLVKERDNALRGAAISAYFDRAVTEWQSRHISDFIALSGRSDLSSASFRSSRIKNHRPRVKALSEHCFEFGPFPGRAELQQWLNEKNIRAHKLIDRAETEVLDFQVYYPAARNAEQVRLNMLMLTAKGFNDVWPVQDGEMKGAISLGVFNDRQRATLFKTQLADRGVNAEIRKRTKTKPLFFVRAVSVPSGSQNVSYSQLPVTECGLAPD